MLPKCYPVVAQIIPNLCNNSVHTFRNKCIVPLENVLIYFMCLRRINAFLRYSWDYRNVVYYDTQEHNVKIELRMRLLRYGGA